MPETQIEYSPPPWEGVIDFCRPDLTSAEAADAVSQIFGEDAVTVAAWCAVQSRQDGDDVRYQLWLATFKQLRAPTHSAAT